MRTMTIVLCAALLTACGGSSDDQVASGSTGGSEDPSAATCEGYTASDSCMDADSFAQCQQMAAQCPGQVGVMESCPMQFACPSSAESPDGDLSDAPSCNGHAADESCMDADSFAQCQRMEAQCPGQVIEAETCPAQFSCP